MISLIDTHAHLDLLASPFEALDEARTAGVSQVIGVAMGGDSARRILSLSESLPEVVLPALGLHPWNIAGEDYEESLRYIEDHLDRAVAVGEIGLDYKVKTGKSLQKTILAKQLMMAQMKNLPVLLHCRFSHQRVLEMVQAAGIRKAVFHWYSGPIDVLQELIHAGYHISATPALKYSPKHQEAVATVPLENLVLETDCPVVYEKYASVPKDVVQVCNLVSRIKGMSVQEVAERTTKNALGLLEKPGISI